MIKLKITKKDVNKKLCDYIKSLNDNLTITSIKREINKGSVKVNNSKVKDNYLLQENDELIIYLKIKKINDKYLKTKIKQRIFYEDENIIIFDKDKNVSCQENENEKINTLNNYLKKYCYEKGYWNGVDLENEPCLVHRLDQNTMGLIIAAKNKTVARIINKNINEQITKKYLTVIYHRPRKKHELLIDYIKRDEQAKNKMIVSNKKLEHSSQIKTKYKCVYTNNDYSILEVELLTGKKHQIRAHLAFHNMYIVGDTKYGLKNKNFKLNYQLLISNQIIFNFNDEKLKYLNNKEFIKIKNFNDVLKLIK